MNYITPDNEVKAAFKKLEGLFEIDKLLVSDFNIYGISRFYLEMLYRIEYYEKKNRTIQTRNDKQLANGILAKQRRIISRHITRGILGKIFTKVKTKYQSLISKIQRSNYLAQYDNINDFKDSVDILFVATSGFKNSQNLSLELYEIIKYEKSKNNKVAFVLPEYDTKIKRRKEYDYFYSIDFENKKEFTKEDLTNINNFKLLVNANVDILSAPVLNGLTNFLSTSIGLAEQLEVIINKIKPRLVVARSLYSDKWVTMACKRTSIRSLEIQHGVFTSNNFYYHPLGKLTSEQLLLPNYIACLGNEWCNILRQQSNSWNEKNSGLIGSPLFINRKPSSKKINVLIAFQDLATRILDIRDDVRCFLDKYSKDLNDFNFILRIHPSNKLSDLNFSLIGFNVSWSDSIEESTLEVLARTDVLISATSMILYEALNFNIPVISFERFRKMTQENKIYFIKSVDDLYDCLKNNKYKSIVQLEYLNDVDFTFYDSLLTNSN